MDDFRTYRTTLLIHATILALYALLPPALPQGVASALETSLALLMLLTSFALTTFAVVARTAPLERELSRSEAGRRELLWRLGNHEPSVARVGSWPSWTVQATQYGTLGLGVLAAVATFFYVSRSGENLRFLDLPPLFALVALAIGLPLLVFHTIYDRCWGEAHPQEVARHGYTQERDALEERYALLDRAHLENLYLWMFDRNRVDPEDRKTLTELYELTVQALSFWQNATDSP